MQQYLRLPVQRLVEDSGVVLRKAQAAGLSLQDAVIPAKAHKR
jgi:hypothetical protein